MDKAFTWDPSRSMAVEAPTRIEEEEEVPVLDTIGLDCDDKAKVEKCLELVGYAPSGQEILMEGISLITMLLEKNERYGDSALNPVRVFSDASTTEQLRVRIDDKISRLSRGSAGGEDVVKDLIGYLILLRIAERD